MTLTIDCTWNDQKKKGKVVIAFDDLPESIFCLKDEDRAVLRVLERGGILQDDSVLEKFEKIYIANPKSIYAAFSYFQALKHFKLEEEAWEVFTEMKNNFPKEVFTFSIEAHYLAEKRNFECFANVLKAEVLKGAFPKRKLFHYKEAMAFHSAWAFYFLVKEEQDKEEKHARFLALVFNTLQSYSITV